jgi:hypothetical protein
MPDPTDERAGDLAWLLGDCKPESGDELPHLLADRPSPDPATGDREAAAKPEEILPAAAHSAAAIEASTPGSEPAPAAVGSEPLADGVETIPLQQTPAQPQQSWVTVDELEEPTPQPNTRRPLAIPLTAVLLLVALVGVALLLHFAWKGEPADKPPRWLNSRTAKMPAKEVKALIAPGMKEEEVNQTLGAPHAQNEFGQGLRTTEFWYYDCSDGRVLITIQDGTVQEVKPL